MATMIATIKVKRILFATDFLGNSRLALDYAVAFAHHFSATLLMLHAIELSSPAREAEAETSRASLTRRAAQQRLDDLAAGVRRTNLNVETYIEDGIASEVILRACSRHGADLLVLGIHGIHRGLGHLIIGSNAEKILLSSTCPTLTVGAHVLGGVDLIPRIEEILYFSDFTPEAASAAPYALFLGKEFHVPVDICQLEPEILGNNLQLRADLAEEYCKTMRNVLGDTHNQWNHPSFQLEHGMEIDQIIDRAQSQHAGLIVLGVRHPSHLGLHLRTSFAYQLLAKATCPVLSVR
jgi:nucleotide-binding universal stress UspA family protein